MSFWSRGGFWAALRFPALIVLVLSILLAAIIPAVPLNLDVQGRTMPIVRSVQSLISQSIHSVRCKFTTSSCIKEMQHQTREVSGSSGVPRFRRICLRSDEDIAKISSLLPKYLEQPDSLAPLKDLTFDRVFYYRYDPSRYRAREFLPPEDVTNAKDSLYAGHVKSLTLSDFVTQQLIDYLPARHANDTERKSARANNVECHATATLLMTLSPNIETIRLQEPNVESPVHEFLLRNNYGELSQSYLQNLKHVHIAPDEGSPYTDSREYCRVDIPRMLSYFHRLPNLESITADTISEDTNQNTLIRPHLSNLKSITITHSCLGSQMLSALIRLPKQNHLEEFHYGNGGRAENFWGYSSVVLKTIGKALETQRSSLRVLELDLEDTVHYSRRLDHLDEGTGYGNEEHWQMSLEHMEEDPHFAKDSRESNYPLHAWELPDTRDFGHTIGSFAHFTELKTLRIGVKTLLGPPRGPAPPFKLIDALPPNLVEFTLIGYRKGDNPVIDPLVEEFMSLKQDKFPFLTKVSGVEEYMEAGHSNYHADEDTDIMWPGVKWDGEWELAQA